MNRAAPATDRALELEVEQAHPMPLQGRLRCEAGELLALVGPSTWGGLLSGSGRTYMFQGPWLALAPGLCLTVVVYATNVFGDALRDLLDPRMRGSK